MKARLWTRFSDPTVDRVSFCGNPETKSALPAPGAPIHDSRHLYTIRGSYTQFPSAIHNSSQLYTIPLGYTQFGGRYTQFRAGYTQFARTYTQFRVGHTRSILSVNDPPFHPQGSFSALRAPGGDIHGRTSVAGEYLRGVARRAAAPRPTEPGHLYTIPDAAIHNSRRLYTIRAAIHNSGSYTQFAPAIHNSRRPSSRRTSRSRRAEERSALAAEAVGSVEPDLGRQSIAPRYPPSIRGLRSSTVRPPVSTSSPFGS